MPIVFPMPQVGPKVQLFDSNGDPLAGGSLEFYVGGTSTPKDTYTSSAGSTANANPITLNASGFPPNEIWGTSGVYKIIAKSSASVTQWTIDNIRPINDVDAATQSEWIASGLTATFISSSQFSLVGDKTTDFHVGRRLKITDSGGTDYLIITASSFASVTTVTVSPASLDSGISSVSLGIVSAVNTSLPNNAARTDQANTFSASNTFAADQTISSTDAGAGAGPKLTLYRNSASPAASDALGTVSFDGKDSAGNQETYGDIVAVIDDATSTSEDAHLLFRVIIAGAFLGRFSLGNGFYAASLSDPGAGKINAASFQKNGTELPIQTIFESSETAIAANTEHNAAHGFGAMPKLFLVVIRCKSAEHGYAVNDETTFSVNAGGDGTHSFYANATNVGVMIDDAICITSRATAATVNITLASWKLVFRAWL